MHRNTNLFLWMLVAVIAAVYFPAINNTTLFDDAQIIRDGHLRSEHLQNIPRIVTGLSFLVVDFVANHNIAAQKLFNVAIHCSVTILLYRFTLRLIGVDTVPDARSDPSDQVGMLWGTRIGVAMFALNPAAVHAVAYLVQRSILLATLFALLTMLAFIEGVQRQRPAWFFAAFLCYGLAVLSKELAVMVVFLLPALYLLVAKPSAKQVGMMLAVAVVLAAATTFLYLSFYQFALMTPYEASATDYAARLDQAQSGTADHLFLLSSLNQMNLFFLYGILWLTGSVQWMALDLHPRFPLINQIGYYLPLAFAYCAALAIAIRLLFATSTRRTLVGVLMLVPLLLFQTELWTVRIQESFAIYRSYLWAICLPGFVAVAVGELSRRLMPVGLGVIVIAAVLAHGRASTMGDELAAWSDAADVSSNNLFFAGLGSWRPYVNRGSIYLARGEMRLALRDYERAEHLGALHGVAQYNIGIIYQMLGQHDMALAAFTHAEIKNKSNFRLKYQIGESLYAIQKFESALGNFEAALLLATNTQERDSIGIRKAETLVNIKRFQEAIEIFTPLAASIIVSDRAGVGLGMAYLGTGNVIRARSTFEELLKKGSLPNAYYGLAMVYEAQQLFTDASKMIDKALTLQPDNQTFVDYRMGLSRRAK